MNKFLYTPIALFFMCIPAQATEKAFCAAAARSNVDCACAYKTAQSKLNDQELTILTDYFSKGQKSLVRHLERLSYSRQERLLFKMKQSTRAIHRNC